MIDLEWMVGRRLLVDFWPPDSWWFSLDFGAYVRARAPWRLTSPSGVLVDSDEPLPPQALLERVRHHLRAGRVTHAVIPPRSDDLVIGLYPDLALRFCDGNWEVRAPAPRPAIAERAGLHGKNA